MDTPLPPTLAEQANQESESELRALNAQLTQRAVQLRELNQRLVDSEQRLSLAIETGRVGVWVWDTTGHFHSLDWSPRLKEIFGLSSKAEVTRELFLSCVHAEDRQRVDAAIMQALAGVDNGEYRIEYRIVHSKDSSLHWVTAQGQAFFNMQGQSIRFIGAVVDVSDRKQAEQYTARLNRELEDRITQRTSDLEQANRTLIDEVEERKRVVEALRQTEDKFHKAIDTIPGLVWTSLPDGHIDYLNKRWLDFTGLTHEAACGWGWMNAVHPDDLPGLVAYWKSILAAGEAGQYEARLRKADGEYRWLLFRGVPFRDEAGVLVKWYGTNTDVQDLRASDHLARGQLNVLTRTLDALSRESDPEQLPKHVVTTIAEQMDAHSVTLWERNGNALDLLGTFEEGNFRTRRETSYFSGSIPVLAEGPPLLVEALRNGEFAVIEDLAKAPVQFTLSDGSAAVWYGEENTPSFIALRKHLLAQGVRAMLVSPMMLAGQFIGIVGIRFTGARIFDRAEIELMKALAQQAMLAIQLMRLSRQSRATAVMAERNRLAQDIHDSLAQGLTGIIVQLEAAEDARLHGLATEADQHQERAARLARESLHEARHSVHALRPRALTEQQLCSALAALIENTTQGTSVAGKFSIQGEPQRLPDAWEQNLLRIVQESLANTLRHAHATEFKVKIIFTVHEIQLHISDNGKGFAPDQNRDGIGLRGLRERTESMGGKLTIQSERGTGTNIEVVIPTVTGT